MASLGKSDKIDTYKLNVTGSTTITGPVNIKQVGGVGSGVVFDLPVCLNDDVKGLFMNCIVVQEEGVNLPNTPHKVLNFIGDSVEIDSSSNAILNVTVTSSGMSEESNCIQQDDSEVCVNSGGGSISMILNGDEYIRLKDNGALQHGFPNPQALGPNCLASGSAINYQSANYNPPNATLNTNASQAFGSGTFVNGIGCHAEGINTSCTDGFANHSEGFGTSAQADMSYAEGLDTIANGVASHAEGVNTWAQTGSFSHVEGFGTATGFSEAHAEGNNCIALAEAAHAEGWDTAATGIASHAEGFGSLAQGYASTAIGIDSWSHMRGQSSYSAGRFTNDGGAQGAISVGDAQCSICVLRANCPQLSSTPLTLDGAGDRLTIPIGATWYLSGCIVARSYDGYEPNGQDVSAWKFTAVADRTSIDDEWSPQVRIVENDFNDIYNTSGIAVVPSILTDFPDRIDIRIATNTNVRYHVVATVYITQVITNSGRIDTGEGE